MKRIASILKVVFMLFVLVTLLTACIVVVPSDSTNPGVPSDGNPDTTTTVKYSVKYQFEGTTLLTQTVTNGIFTQEQIAEKNALLAKGKVVTGFFQDSAKTIPFDFTKKITANTTVYCQVLYKVTYYYGKDVILEQYVDSAAKYLTQNQYDAASRLSQGATKYSGFYRDAEKTQVFNLDSMITNDVNVYCQLLFNVRYEHKGLFVMDQQVDAVDGFTEEQIEAAKNYYYNGFRFSVFYTDENLTNEFTFNRAPTKNNFTIYCDRDYTKAGDNVTWSISDDGTHLSFTGEGPMYEFRYHDTDVPWNKYKNTVTDISIETGITTIANHAFYEFSKIDIVDIPETITFIGNNAFHKSTVRDLNFPDSLKRIGEHAFTECFNLVNLDFNHGLESIGIGAFNGCTSVVTVVLTNTIILLGNSAFLNCNNISAAYYVGNQEQYDAIVIDIDNFWLRDLAHTYYISQEKPTEPGPYWYYDEEGEIKQWYNTIWYRANPAVFTPTFVDYIDVDTGVTQANIDFMANIVYEGYKFAYWTIVGEKEEYVLTLGQRFDSDIKLLGERGNLCGDNLKWTLSAGKLTISKIDQTIDDAVMWDFEYAKSAPWRGKTINSIELKDVTYIGQNAFYMIYNQQSPYKSLTYIDIPVCVTAVHPSAFISCNDLLYVYYAGTPEQLALVEGISSLTNGEHTKVYARIEAADYSKYTEGAYWTIIKENRLNRRVAWAFEDGVLTVGGGDNSYHTVLGYSSVENTPWYSYASEITKVVICSNITTIGSHCFENIESITDIVIPTRLLSVAANTFDGTGYYNNLYNNDGVVYIYANTAAGSGIKYGILIAVNPEMAGELFCIQSYTIAIAENAFEGCSNIKSLIFPKDIVSSAVYSGALNGLTSLEGIYYDGRVETWQTTFTEILPEEINPTIYYYSSLKPSDTTNQYWRWNETKDEPVLWVISENEA